MKRKILDVLAQFNLESTDIDVQVVTPGRGINGMATIVANNGKVYKVPLFPEGIQVLEQIRDNHHMMKERGLSVVDMEFINGIGVMDRISYPTITEYVRECIANDNVSHIFECIDKVYCGILHSSHYSEEINSQFSDYKDILGMRPIMQNGFIEILPHNAFYTGDNVIYFDQEVQEENIPAGFIFSRFIRHLFFGVPSLHFYIPLIEFKEKYECIAGNMWNLYSRVGYDKYADRKANAKVLDKLLGNITIVGAGNWCMILLDILEQHGRLDDVKMILDNDERKWKHSIYGIPVEGIDYNADKKCTDNVLIAIKDNTEIVKQLKSINISMNKVYLMSFSGYKMSLERYMK